MFRVGQKVVCVDDSDGHIALLNGKIKRGAIYEVRGICQHLPAGEIGVWLCECVVPALTFSDGYVCEPSWRIARFRPLVERETDIGLLTALLDPANHKKFENA